MAGAYPDFPLLAPLLALIDWFDFLQHQLFKIGSLPVTPIFLIKACVFLFLLVAASRLLQQVLLTRLLHYLHIAEAQKFALGRFATYLFFLGGVFVSLQSLGVNLSSLSFSQSITGTDNYTISETGNAANKSRQHA